MLTAAYFNSLPGQMTLKVISVKQKPLAEPYLIIFSVVKNKCVFLCIFYPCISVISISVFTTPCIVLSFCHFWTELRELRGAIQKDLKLYPSSAASSPSSLPLLQSKDSKTLRLVSFGPCDPRNGIVGHLLLLLTTTTTTIFRAAENNSSIHHKFFCKFW